MISFEVIKQSKRSRARLGVLRTPHGEVLTPSLVPVATQASVKTLSSEEAAAAKTQILIANTFHLHLKPGERTVEKMGGLHRFMAWPKPLMTDSGGFQVFSLGFGRDLGVGKILKYFPENGRAEVKPGAQPSRLRITDDGVFFRSPIQGDELFIGPKESVKIQESLGADIIFAFDECTPPLASKSYAAEALARTNRWAKRCLAAKKSSQALFGIVQGSHYKDLREASAEFIGKLPFDGYGIGGDLGKTKADMAKIIRWTLPFLDAGKPRHLLGIGHPEDMERIAKEGVDTFDCIIPTHYARRGIAFTKNGELDLNKSKFLGDTKPLDKTCECYVCRTYRRGYLSHLFRAKEITGMGLLTFHNLFYFNSIVERIRGKIERGLL